MIETENNYNIQLNSLKLENFRGFDSLYMDFHKNLTLLIGENGSGKTSILDAVAIFLRFIVAKIKDYNHTPNRKL